MNCLELRTKTVNHNFDKMRIYKEIDSFSLAISFSRPTPLKRNFLRSFVKRANKLKKPVATCLGKDMNFWTIVRFLDLSLPWTLSGHEMSENNYSLGKYELTFYRRNELYDWSADVMRWIPLHGFHFVLKQRWLQSNKGITWTRWPLEDE